MQHHDSNRPWDISPEEREQRRLRVLNRINEAGEDAGHQRAMFRSRVAGQLSALIARASISAAKIARKTGVSAPQISRQLSGKANLTLDSVHSIASAAGATVEVSFRLADDIATQAQGVRSLLVATTRAVSSEEPWREEILVGTQSQVDRGTLFKLLKYHQNFGGKEVRVESNQSQLEMAMNFPAANDNVVQSMAAAA
jgi:transcriptional regulator with XRE-family HTH domain